jgi:hypothetical protein
MNPDNYTLLVAACVALVTDWADYVFDKKYPLLPLKEVGTFIEKNGHLPNIPTTEEMRVNGLNVAEMDKKLLEKIEELTLYILQQQKQIEDQKKLMEAQQRQIDLILQKLEKN